MRSNDHLVQSGVTRHEVSQKTGVIVTGSEKRVPHYLWKKKFKRTEADEGQTEQGNRVEAKFIPIKGIASRGSEFLAALSHAAAETGKYEAFENEVVKTLVQHKWETYICKLFMRSLYLDIAMVLFLTADVLSFGHVDEAFSNVLSVLTLVFWLYFTREEFKQVRSASREAKNLERPSLVNAISDAINAASSATRFDRCSCALPGLPTSTSPTFGTCSTSLHSSLSLVVTYLGTALKVDLPLVRGPCPCLPLPFP